MWLWIIIIAIVIGAILGAIFGSKDDDAGSGAASGAMAGGCLAIGCLGRLALWGICIIIGLWLLNAIFG